MLFERCKMNSTASVKSLFTSVWRTSSIKHLLSDLFNCFFFEEDVMSRPEVDVPGSCYVVCSSLKSRFASGLLGEYHVSSSGLASDSMSLLSSKKHSKSLSSFSSSIEIAILRDVRTYVRTRATRHDNEVLRGARGA